jgi:2-phosphosulfolactate phosphatase
MRQTVTIDCFPEAVPRYRDGHAIVAIDVIRATTTAITAVAQGRRCFPVPTVEAAFRVASALTRPLLAGELGGVTPAGFDLPNSPAALARRADIDRPLVLLSSAGTQVIHLARGLPAVYLASLRNHQATAAYLSARFPRVALIGAGTRGEFRQEDQVCCAWIAGALMWRGYEAGDAMTAVLVERWRGASPAACASGRSAAYLRRTGQWPDLEFILSHVGDLDAVFQMQDGQIVMAAAGHRASGAVTVRSWGVRA